MKLPQLLDDIRHAVETENSTQNSHTVLVQQVADMADMVGWADGPIDPERKILSRLETLMDSLRERYERTTEPSIAALHDVLAELYSAIERHDQDLERRSDPDEEELF